MMRRVRDSVRPYPKAVLFELADEGFACNQPHGIPVDIHVHRVVNRWGYISARTPEKTMAELEKVLPRRYWVEINKLMVPFGKNLCTGKAPKCSTCPVLDYCRQVGVTTRR